MRRISLVIAVCAVAACGPKEEPAADTSAAAAPSAPALALADLAGNWTGRLMPQNSDSTLVTFDMVASADPSAWTLTLPNRPPVPVRPVVDGDSLITDVGPIESVLRKGAQVTTHSVLRLVNGELVGTATSRYQGGTGDSVVTFRQVATRKP